MEKPIVFNITIKLAESDAPSFIESLASRILPDCTDGQIITSSQVNRIVLAEQDGDDETFAIQFIYPSSSVFKEQKLLTMAKFLGLLDEQFRGKYVYFATMMELLHHQK